MTFHKHCLLQFKSELLLFRDFINNQHVSVIPRNPVMFVSTTFFLTAHHYLYFLKRKS